MSYPGTNLDGYVPKNCDEVQKIDESLSQEEQDQIRDQNQLCNIWREIKASAVGEFNMKTYIDDPMG